MSNGKYRFDSHVPAKYPEKGHELAFSCTATGDKVDDFDLITDISKVAEHV